MAVLHSGLTYFDVQSPLPSTDSFAAIPVGSLIQRPSKPNLTDVEAEEPVHLGRISELTLRKTPSSLSPSANSVGSGKSAQD